MRYRRRLHLPQAILGIAVGGWIYSSLTEAPLRKVLGTMVGLALASASAYWWQYWDILPDGVVSRNFWSKKKWMFTDIAYVGPPEGLAAEVSAARKWIVIRDRNGRRLVVQPADREGFLAEMRHYLPNVNA
jgi:hypothetical protein